jgi:ATP-dependent DNA helicase RecG
VNSTHNESKSTHNDGKSLHNEVKITRSEDDYLHNEELQRITQTSQNKKRLSPKVTEQIILELCEGRWLTRHQLSKLMARNAESLRERFLNPMLAKGTLKLRYPDKPNHVGQAYTATGLVKENEVPLTKPKAK